MRSSPQLRRRDGPRIPAGTLPRVLAAVLLASAAALVSGCSSMIADHLPAAVGGLPDDTPARPAADTAYPAVHSMPPARATTPLSYDQQKRLQDDLEAARNRVDTSPDDSTATTPAPTAPAASGSTANAKAGSARNP